MVTTASVGRLPGAGHDREGVERQLGNACRVTRMPVSPRVERLESDEKCFCLVPGLERLQDSGAARAWIRDGDRRGERPMALRLLGVESGGCALRPCRMSQRATEGGRRGSGDH